MAQREQAMARYAAVLRPHWTITGYPLAEAARRGDIWWRCAVLRSAVLASRSTASQDQWGWWSVLDAGGLIAAAAGKGLPARSNGRAADRGAGTDAEYLPTASDQCGQRPTAR